jgi:hypothetical protein
MSGEIERARPKFGVCLRETSSRWQDRKADRCNNRR